jgi:hypothetical protein
MCANMRPQNQFAGFAAFNAVPAENRDLDHRMPVRGKRHHAFFDGQGKVDDLHNKFVWILTQLSGSLAAVLAIDQ